MRDRTILPTNLLNWPRVEPLITEQKFILLALWAAPWLSCAGVGELPLRAFSTCLGLSHEATEVGLQNLIEAGLIDIDCVTNEVVVLDWFRFHKFANGKSVISLNCAIAKIQSQSIKNVILEKSISCLPTSTTTSTSTSTSTENTPLPPKGGVGDGEDESTDEKTMTGGADAPAASREKSAGQEKGLVTVATQVNGDLFGEHQDSTLNASPAGNGLAGEPPSCAPPPVPAGSKKMAAKVVDEPIALPEWIKPEDWVAFINERKGSKKPMSAEAQRRAIGVLEKLRAEGNDPAAVINQSIVSGWMGLFALKNNGGRTSSVPQSRQAVRDAMSGMHHGFDKKDYSEGVTADGRLID